MAGAWWGLEGAQLICPLPDLPQAQTGQRPATSSSSSRNRMPASRTPSCGRDRHYRSGASCLAPAFRALAPPQLSFSVILFWGQGDGHI